MLRVMSCKCRLLVTFTLLTVVSRVSAVFDSAFCNKYVDRNDTNQGYSAPVFYDNYYVYLETKGDSAKSVTNEEVYFSNVAGLAYGIIRQAANQVQLWVDTATDEIVAGPLGMKVCAEYLINGTSLASLLGVNVNSKGNVTLSTPAAALGWDATSQKKIKYVGGDTSRGIQTIVWQLCINNPNSPELTEVQTWHIVDPMITLPAVQKNAIPLPELPVTVLVNGVNNSNPNLPQYYSQRMDFMLFDSVSPQDDIFQIPTNMLCSIKPSAQVPLPATPTYFRFKGEQITTEGAMLSDASISSLTYTTEEFSQLSNLFVQDFVSTPLNPGSGNDKSLTRTVDDFNTGLSFNLDLASGSCIVQVIEDGVDTISVAGGNVQLRTSQQFFDLDSDQYQYMGVHKKRGITCDTWSARFNDAKNYHPQGSLYTWYFATNQWKIDNGFVNSLPLPVALEVQSDMEQILFNFYEFDTQDIMQAPDISTCFTPNTTMNIEFYILATFTQVVMPDVRGFKRAVMAAIVAQTKLTSILRITELDVQPASNSEILVIFKLLDLASVNIVGDVSNKEYDAPNSVIYQDLSKLVNAGTFSVDVIMDTPSGSAKTTVRAKPNSIGVYKSGKQILAKSNSSGSFGPGPMAGVGVGLLVLGIILGVVGIFLFRKVRTGGNSGSPKERLEVEEAS